MKPTKRVIRLGSSTLALAIAAHVSVASAQAPAQGGAASPAGPARSTTDEPVAPPIPTNAQTAGAPAGAQVTTIEQPASEPEAAQATDETGTGQDIIVTGTNISGVKPVGSQTLAIDRSQVLATGYTNVNDVLQTIPQVQNNPNSGGSGPVYRQGGTAGYGGNATQGTAINLRGLGTSATLTLVDGRRVVPSGAASTFTESIQIPVAALERIEVVSDGNSAIYGSDAISGVINYVLRKKFDGLEVSGRDTFNRYNNVWGVSVTAGKSWDTGNIIITYDHEDRDPFTSGRSKFLRRDLTTLGGVDSRANNATLGVSTPTLVTGGNGVPYAYYTIPTNAAPGTTFAQLTPGANLVDQSDFTDFVGRQKRDQAAVFINQDLTPTLSLYLESFYTKRETSSRSYGNSRVGNNVLVCQGSPYYINGAPASASAANADCGGALAQTVAVDPITFFGGPSVTKNPTETISVTGGMTGHLPNRWNVDTYFTYAHDSTCGICNFDNNANGAALAAQITAGRINPYGNAPLSSEQYATFLGTNTQYSYNTFVDSVVKLDGPLFSLPGGEVRTAFGGELAYNRQHLRNGSNNAFENARTNNAFAITNDSATQRSTASVFAELFVPIVGSDMNVPLIQELNLDAAVRYDNYSDFGGTTNPKFGATWTVNDFLSIRGSWGTSFRAPALTDTNPNNYSSAVIGLPFANNSGRQDIALLYPGFSSTYILLGANRDLRPETATTWSAGFDVKPAGSGFRFSGTYYNTHYSNQIVGQNVGLFLSNPANAALYSQYIQPVSNPANCVNGNPATYDPRLANFIAANPALYNTPVLSACTVGVILDARNANAATTFQDGLDFQTFYQFETGFGRWNIGASVTKILNQTLQQVSGGATVDVLDTYYYPVSLRGRGQLSWNLGGLGVNAFLNYTGSYTNTIPITGRDQTKVPSWKTLDIGITYSVPRTSGVLRGVRLSANFQNITNEDPPLVLTQAGANYGAYDPSNANILGRIVTFQLTKAF
ncbi:TonB-dependent siderophore receptor [uncultured Sphingomonas sp.]|uniref:TonB-dependent receptor plug domain-containing protein n=1 Tax=uncultured Sphingomonas sp. TaxID=158754 RepID=UPI0025EA316C|nr:TonB-dependent receptor [uncultured Sphingomonas sp.]